MRDEQSHDITTADPHEPAEADTGTRTEYRVEIEPNGKAASIGQRYKATFDGEVIVASSKDAEFDACRVLLDRGIAGTMVTFFPGGTVPRICLDIEKGAILSAVENATEGPVIRKWRPNIFATQEDDAE